VLLLFRHVQQEHFFVQIPFFRRTFLRFMRLISMDAKDLLIKELQAQLQRKDEQLERIEAKLHEVASHHTSVTEQFSQALEEKDRKIALLESKIKRLLSTVRGSRQERINPDQLLLFSEDELQQLAQELEKRADDNVTQPDQHQEADQPQNPGSPEEPAKKGSGRRPLPSNWPKEIRRHELSEEERKCPCCGETRCEMGVETSQQIEFIPAVFKVIEHHRVQYACKSCQENVAIAPKPPQPIEKGLPGPGLCSYVVLSKFGDHLPLYREEDLFSRMGWLIRRSTICDWLYELGLLVEPLVMRMKHLVLQSAVIHTDDTKIKMLDIGICREAKFWPYQGDWLHPYVVFDFTLDRSRNGPKKFLENYQGYLQADAYSGYDCVYASGLVKEVACWIHTRRYWYDARDYDKTRANIALGYIARLSQIESQLRTRFPLKTQQGERDFEAIARARQEHSRPILTEFKNWMEGELNGGRILPKSLIKSAFTYTLNQWDALCRYTEAGYLSFDNNAAERLVKYPAIGRKNFLFVGNQRAGRNAANFYSLVTSAKLNGVEPFAWLTDVMKRLPHYRTREAFAQSASGGSVTSNELDEMLPDRWLKTHPDYKWEIDAIRREERRKKEARKRQLKKRKKSR
jgi:transposase